MKKFDQWTEEISKQVVIRSDEEGVEKGLKVLWKTNDLLMNDDFEEEESS